jgi:hypothetical protein
MNFTPLTEEDLKSEKAKQLANIYRFMDYVFDETKKETKLSYKDSMEVNNAVIKSFSEFKEILLKNLIESVGFLKGKENELSAFIGSVLTPNPDNQPQIPDLDSLFASFNMVTRNKLYFAKSENEVKYDGMFFGRIVNDYETGKLTVDEVNDRCWKYAKMIQEQTHNWTNFGRMNF